MIFLRNLFGKGRESGAGLTCPACRGSKVKFIEDLGCGMEQWRCARDGCHQKFRYQRKAIPQYLDNADDIRKRPELVLGNTGYRLSSRQFAMLKKNTKGA